MTADEVMVRAAARFVVHEEIGFGERWVDQNDKPLGDYVDRTLAPCGKPYFLMTSYGVDPDFLASPVLFADSHTAMEWLADEIDFFGNDNPECVHLYWKTKPVFVAADFMNAGMGDAMRVGSPIARIPMITLGFACCEMLITNLEPK